MSKQAKTTITLSALLIILVGALVFNNNRIDQAQQEQSTSKELFSEFSDADISKISIKRGEDETRLEQQDDKWIIATADNAPADETAIASLIREARRATIQTVITENAEKVEEYGLDEEKRLHLTLYKQEEAIAEFYMGKTGAAAQTFYAQRIDDNSILLINGSRYVFSKSDWEAEEPEVEEDGEVAAEAEDAIIE